MSDSQSRYKTGQYTNKHKSRCKALFSSLLLITFIVAGSLFLDVRDLCAHSPHDPIDALALSPTYAQDKTLFIVISDQILRSTDGGFSWQALVNGLDNKHLLSSIAIAPAHHADKVLFISSVGDGIYRSQDEGDSWVKVNNGLANLNIGLLSIYPGYHSHRIVLAAGTTGGLYKTEDGGANWHQVLDDDITISAIAFSPDPNESTVLAGDHRGVLYSSTDNGAAWQQTLQAPNAGAITSIAIAPNFSSDGTFFLGTEKGGVFRTDDGGVSFTTVNKGLRFTIRGKYGTFRRSAEGPIIRRDEKGITSIAISPDYASDSTVFISMWNESIFKSDDGGNTWKKYPLGLTCHSQADSEKYKSPHFRDLRISDDFENDETVFLGGFDGLFKSTDGGHHWSQMETLPLGLIKGLALSPGDGNSLAVALTTYGGGACTTEDQGITWAINNNGLKTTRLSDIGFSPIYQTDNTLFSASRGYLLKSTDRGDTWDKIALDYTKNGTTSWRKRIVSVLSKLRIPSSLSKRIFLTETERKTPFATVLAISPDYASDNTMYFGTRYHGIYKSVDGGLNPTVIWDGLGRTITSLAISPDYTSDATLFASVRGAGVYKTVDGGDTWQPANDGLTFIEAWQSPTAHQITEKDIRLVISPNYQADQTVFAASSEGLFKTTDRGKSWQELEDPAYGEDGYIIGMAISPNYENDETLVVSIRGKGLFTSGNGGIIFTGTGSGLIDNNHEIEYIEFSASYATDNTIYAASDAELFKSIDGGNTWEIITRPVRYENMREVVRYDGTWNISKGDDFSASSVSYSDVAQDEAWLDFVGTGVTWIGTASNAQGIARVYIDGKYVGDVDQFSDTPQAMVRSFSVTGLARGPHTIAIEVTDTKNPASQGYRIEIDALDIAP
ncbi:MAG: hypothetical protein SWK90_09670 [Chloroflexota bacterium]|nr:hypothetical protein [Chloroflexota bacterium]